MARGWYRAQALARASTNSTAYVDCVALSFAPTAETTYYLLWSAQSDCSSNGRNNQLRLRDDTGAATLASPVARVSSAADDTISFGGIARWTAGAAPGTRTFSVEHAINIGDATIGTADTYLVALQAQPGDAFAESAGTSSTSSSALADKATLSFTPEAAGDYLILFSAELSGLIPSTAQGNCRALLEVDGTAYFDTQDGLASRTSSQFGSWSGAVRASLTAAPHTVKLRYAAADNVNAVSIRQAAILAMRLDGFAGHATGQDNTRQATSATAPQVAASASLTAQAGEHLVIAAALVDHATSSNSALTRVSVDGGTASPWQRVQVGGATRRMPSFMLGYAALAAGARTASLDYWNEASSSGITDAFIGVLDPGVDALAVAAPAAGLDLVGRTPAALTDRALAAPAGALALSGAAPVAALALAAPAPPLAASGRAPTAAVDAALRPPAAPVPLRAHAPVRAGPLWQAPAPVAAAWTVSETAAGGWTPVAQIPATWTPVAFEEA
jgi:hypothetical protein